MPHACLCRTAHRSLSLGFAAALRTSGRCAVRNETSAGLRTWGASCRSTRASRHFCTFKFLSLDLPRLGHPRPTAEATEEGSYGGGLRRCHEVDPLRQARGQLRSQLGQRVESWAAGRQSIEEEACQFHREIFLARKHRRRSTTVAKCRSSPCNALIYPNTISTPPRRFGPAAGRCLGTDPRQR